MDITKQKKTIPAGAATFLPASAPATLFGQLLAFQFAEWLETEIGGRKSEVRIIEAGAHDGTLAKDILNWLQLARPELFEPDPILYHRAIRPPTGLAKGKTGKIRAARPLVRRF